MMAKHLAAMSFFLERDLLRALDELARQERRNRSAMVRELIVREMERKGLSLEVVSEVGVTE
jgi:predicted transcriptional regulator